MATKERACLGCKTLYEGDKCPACGENTFTESWKGKIYILDAEKSEIAKNMKITKSGLMAIKTK